MPYKDPADKAKNRIWRMERSRAIVKTAKERPCLDCGVKLPWECMDLDHVRGTFSFWLGDGRLDCSEQRVIDEIAKCEVRCPNCHRMRHYRDGSWGKTALTA